MRVSPVLARFLPVLSLAFAFVQSLAGGPFDLRLELLTGQPLPGTPAVLAGVSDVRSNDAGDFVFLADLRDQDAAGTRKWGVFFKHGEEVKKVIVQGEVLPGGARFLSPDGPVMLDLNNGGTVAILVKQGILLNDAKGLRWLVQAGSKVPGTSLSIQQFVLPSLTDYFSPEACPYRPFLNQENSVAFRASLSDGRVGVFRALPNGAIVQVLLPGDPRPNRAGSNFGSLLDISQMQLAGDSLLLRVKESSSFAGVYLHRAGVLRTRNNGRQPARSRRCRGGWRDGGKFRRGDRRVPRFR